MYAVRMFTIGIAATLALGCSEATGITAEDLAGTWNATSIVFTNQANTAESVDIIVRDGASFTMTVQASGSISTTFNDGQGGNSSDSGTFSSTGSSVTLGGDTYQAVRSGNTLTLTNNAEMFDFDDNGSDEPATLVATLKKQ